MNKIFISFLLFTSYNIFSQTSILIKKDIPLYNPLVSWNYISSIKLLDTNYSFNGYLIVNISSDSTILTNNFDTLNNIYSANIYFLEDLSNIKNIYSGFQYTTAFKILFANIDYPSKNTDDKLISFLKKFKELTKVQEKIYLNKFNNELTSDSLLSYSNLWTNDGTQFSIIYKCKFNTAILQYHDETSKNITIFLPVSPLFEFRKIDLIEGEQNNLHKSDVHFVVK